MSLEGHLNLSVVILSVQTVETSENDRSTVRMTGSKAGVYENQPLSRWNLPVHSWLVDSDASLQRSWHTIPLARSSWVMNHSWKALQILFQGPVEPQSGGAAACVTTG